jgi:Ca2+-binding RTX toxin-like protein
VIDTSGESIVVSRGTDIATVVNVERLQFDDAYLENDLMLVNGSNVAPTGGIMIDGSAETGAVLMVVSSLEDADGVGSLSYQWQRDGATIVGETAATYTVDNADIGARITVSASYTDGRGKLESVASTPSSVVVERVVDLGTSGADIFVGTPLRDVYDGLGGNDVISGGGGADALRGDADDDHVYGDGFELRYALPEANQVFRLYQATLNRAPDEMGQKRWTGELFTDQSDLADVREGFVKSPEFRAKYDALDDAGFVKQMYINVLDRDFDQGEVTQTEIDNWTNRITDTFTRADVVNGFAESQQLINSTLAAANKLAVNGNDAAWGDDVYRLYRATLDRDPDTTGFGNWSERLADGRPLGEVITGFTNSQEFQNAYGALTDPEDFVKQLYNNVLDRDFDSGEVSQTEVDNWVSRLSETFTRANIVEGFSQSVQFRNNTSDDVKTWIRAQGVDDQIEGGAGTNVLAGGTLADRFVFNQGDTATNTVVDLEAWDYLSLEGFGYSTDADARANMQQSGSSVVFTDQGTTITFERLQLGDLMDDMILV